MAKMIKKEMFAKAIEVLSYVEFEGKDEVLTGLAHELELLESRKGGSSKPTKTQVENEGYKAAIVETLTEEDRPMTISEVMETCEGIAGLKNQRVSALMTQLKNAGIVVRTEDKKKAYFSIAD